jgi:hypothetical protein
LSELTDLIRQVNKLQTDFENLTKPEVGGVWSDWTPAVDQNGAVAATVVFARYTTIWANTIVATTRLNITGAGVAGNAIEVSGLPFSGADEADNALIGWGSILDNGTAFYPNVVAFTATGELRFIGWNQTGVIGVTPNFALASGDRIRFTVIYERA